MRRERGNERWVRVQNERKGERKGEGERGYRKE